MTTQFVTQHLLELAGNTRLGTLSVSRPFSPIGEVVSAFPELYSLSLYGATLLASDFKQIARLTHLFSEPYGNFCKFAGTQISKPSAKSPTLIPDKVHCNGRICSRTC